MTVLADLAIANANKQKTLINAVSEVTPFLSQRLPLITANSGYQHIYEELRAADGNSSTYWVDFNAALSALTSDSALEALDVKKIGGTVSCGYDTALNYPGGVAAYFANKIPRNLRMMAMQAEYEILYNSFRARAIASGNKINATGTGGGSVYGSIIALRLVEEENCGFITSYARENGFFSMVPLNGGQPTKNYSTGVTEYEMDVVGYLGILQNKGNNNYSAVIANIDSTHVPTEAMIDQALDYVRADQGNNVVLVMTPRTRRYINVYNQQRIRTVISTGTVASGPSIAQRFEDWDGIPIVVTRNMIDTEAEVTGF